MQPFTTIEATAAPLPINNVDTDMIIPKQFLKTIKRTGLKEGLFYEMRFRVDGSKVEEFVLHQKPYDEAEVLIAGQNFGCGSSREHAPWALLDFGIRCVIAESFADIFFNNCFKNGILPVVLPKEAVSNLMDAAKNKHKVRVDLENQTIEALDHTSAKYTFEVEPFRKHCLINGLDDIGLTFNKLDEISSYEDKQRQQTPWLAKAS
jgi:3-isopropylmalate/(R)-2-methylmalate dehydratase small subunit